MLTIGRETLDQPEVQDLLDQADARSASLYPADNRFGSSLADLLAQDARFVVARSAGRVVGCGGYVLGPGRWAELKRIFVGPAARGAGVGRRIVSTIKQEAQGEGVVGLLMETGIRSIEAIGLYHSLGYTRRGPFGPYGADPLSVFMEKPLGGLQVRRAPGTAV